MIPSAVMMYVFSINGMECHLGNAGSKKKKSKLFPANAEK